MSEIKDRFLVSIITPTYNSSKFIEETIESILSQTYFDWELIITDDCSSDNTWNIIEEYSKKDKRIKIFRLNKNLGAGLARNNSIKHTQGRFIAFCDSDDIWHPQKLKKHVEFMIKHKVAFSHTSYGFIDEEGRKIKETYHVSNHPVKYKDALRRTEISCLTAMYDVNMVGKSYMPDLRRKQDYALWLDILKRGFNSIPLDEELAYYRQRKGSVTNKKHKLIIGHFNFLRNQEKLSFIASIKYTLIWMYNGILKFYIS